MSVRKASGYVFVGLVTSGGIRHVGVHRLVLEAFVGVCPDGMQTRHLSGVRRDNRLENLRWGTAQENAQDRERHGTHRRGEDSPNAKLTASQVMEVWRLRAQNVPREDVATTLGLSASVVAKLSRRGKVWRSLDLAGLTFLRVSGAKLSDARRARGLSRNMLAVRARVNSVVPRRVEAGDLIPPWPSVVKMAAVLGVPPESLCDVIALADASEDDLPRQGTGSHKTGTT